MVNRWNGNLDSCTLEWLREYARMIDEGEYVTLTTESGEPIATVDAMTAQDLCEEAA